MSQDRPSMLQREFSEKRGRLSDLMATQGLGGLLLCRSANWSWATCGRQANIAINSETASAALLFTPRRNYLIADRIEMPRLLAEEMSGLPFEPLEFPWYAPSRRDALFASLSEGPLGADIPLEGARLVADGVAALRHNLTKEEQTRFRALGRITGEALSAAAHRIEPGDTEFAIAATLAYETRVRGATPVVTLVAVDDRVRRFRHPIPTDRRLERYAMLVVCARKYGLVASATRLVHIGPPPEDLLHRAAACAHIDAVAHQATRAGTPLAEVFEAMLEAYATAGYSHEWRDHHQGGLAGYENRELVANPRVAGRVSLGQAYAWNPSIAGVKSEDTILVGEDGPELITGTKDWPILDLTLNGERWPRPAILVR